MTEGFLGRWSRRKADVREGRVVEEHQPPAPTPVSEPAAVTPQPVPAAPDADEPPAPMPTLEQAQALTPDADFKPFVARNVAPEVRNAAMKKLFADPHFNVMDGLDIYIDDYSRPDPLPAQVLRDLASAQFMGLVAQPAAAEGREPEQALRASAAPAAEDVAQSRVCNAIPSEPAPTAEGHPAPAERPASQKNHDHADLRLQPDHAPQREGVGRGTE